MSQILLTDLHVKLRFEVSCNFPPSADEGENKQTKKRTKLQEQEGKHVFDKMGTLTSIKKITTVVNESIFLLQREIDAVRGLENRRYVELKQRKLVTIKCVSQRSLIEMKGCDFVVMD